MLAPVLVDEGAVAQIDVCGRLRILRRRGRVLGMVVGAVIVFVIVAPPVVAVVPVTMRTRFSAVG